MASIQLSRYEAEEGELPNVCMCCGTVATERKRRVFISHPLWVYLLLPMGYLPYVVVAAVLTQRTRCYTLFCSRHKNYWRNRTLLIWGALPVILALIIGSLVLVFSFEDQLSKSLRDIVPGLLCIGSFALLFCWLASIPIMQETAIHTAAVTERRVTLKRVSPAFVEDYGRHFRPCQYDPDSFRGEGNRPEK
jgi:hypothetical protein